MYNPDHFTSYASFRTWAIAEIKMRDNAKQIAKNYPQQIPTTPQGWKELQKLK